jgi:hypothetical protein
MNDKPANDKPADQAANDKAAEIGAKRAAELLAAADDDNWLGV